ncbi:UNVERIFIED_CONTAM: hypothetical protein FKN15_076705 [Acipenser sinensis]
MRWKKDQEARDREEAEYIRARYPRSCRSPLLCPLCNQQHQFATCPFRYYEEPERPRPEREESVRPWPERKESVRPVSRGEEPVRPVSGGEEPVRPVSGGEEPVRPVSGGEEPVRPVSGGEELVPRADGLPPIFCPINVVSQVSYWVKHMELSLSVRLERRWMESLQFHRLVDMEC